MNCTIYVAKTKALISFANLIYVFVFAYAKSRFSHNEAHIVSDAFSGFYDSYEIIEETSRPGTGAIPKRKASCKRKITKVYRDSTTLVNLCPTWPEKLRILDVHPVVQEYMDNRLRPVEKASAQQVVPFYDAHWKNKVLMR